jgi:hypothetical protein
LEGVANTLDGNSWVQGNLLSVKTESLFISLNNNFEFLGTTVRGGSWGNVVGNVVVNGSVVDSSTLDDRGNEVGVDSDSLVEVVGNLTQGLQLSNSEVLSSFLSFHLFLGSTASSDGTSVGLAVRGQSVADEVSDDTTVQSRSLTTEDRVLLETSWNESYFLSVAWVSTECNFELGSVSTADSEVTGGNLSDSWGALDRSWSNNGNRGSERGDNGVSVGWREREDADCVGGDVVSDIVVQYVIVHDVVDNIVVDVDGVVVSNSGSHTVEVLDFSETVVLYKYIKTLTISKKKKKKSYSR